MLSMIYKKELVTEGDFVTDDLFTGVLHRVEEKDGVLGINVNNTFRLLSDFSQQPFRFIIRNVC